MVSGREAMKSCARLDCATQGFALMLRRSSLLREFRRPLEFGVMA